MNNIRRGCRINDLRSLGRQPLFCCAKALQEALQKIQQKSLQETLQNRDVMRLLILNLRVHPLHRQR